MTIQKTKRCEGLRALLGLAYKDQWACSDEYPNHEMPFELFGDKRTNPDGKQKSCQKCKDLYNNRMPRHPETNQRKMNWLAARAKEYYGGMPKDPKTDQHWKLCRDMATKDAESIAWVIPAMPNESAPPEPMSPAEGKIDNVIAFKVKEDFGPRTPMTKREPAKVIGKKVSEGWVYIIRNPEVPQHLKVGKTFPNGIGDIMTAYRRCGRAELVHKEWAEHAEIAEKRYAHVALNEFNLRKKGYTDVGTEVFEVSVEKAIEAVKIACDIVNDPDWDGIVDVGVTNVPI